MSEYIFDVVNQTSYLDWSYPFQRTDPFPLDRSSLFSSFADAQAYARKDGTDERGLGGSAYVGQVISVYEAESNNVDLYIINAEYELEPVGSASIGDDQTIEIVDNKIQLKDFCKSYYAYVPAEVDEAGNVITEAYYVLTEGFKEGLEPKVILSDGKYQIAWYEPNQEIIDGVVDALDNLEQKIENLENGLSSRTDKLEEDVNQISTTLGEKANSADVYTKTEADNAIKTAIENVNHLKRITVVDIESIDTDAPDAEQYIYMIFNADKGSYDEYLVANGEVEKVGDWDVDLSDYTKTEDLEKLLNGKVDKVANHSLISNDLIEKLNNIESGAQVNYIDKVDDSFIVLEGLLSLNRIPQEKIIDLVDDLNSIDNSIDSLQALLESKVDEVEGSRLITSEEINKLSSIQDLIKSVNSTYFAVNESGQLNLNDIPTSKITNLDTLLNGKVDAIEDWTLLSPTDKAKLDALVLGDDNNIEISGKVNASNVEGLEDWITSRSSTVKGLSENNLTDELLEKLNNAEANFISSVNEEQMSVESGKLNIHTIAQSNVSGLVEALNNMSTFMTTTDERLNAVEDSIIWKDMG